MRYPDSTKPLGVLEMRLRTVLLVVLCAVLWATPSLGRSYEFFRTDRNVALLNNPSNAAYSGLRIVFSGDVVLLQTLGIGASIQLLSNENGVVVLQGTILPLATCEIDWPIDGPRVERAFWLGTDGDEYEIDVRSPLARMFFVIPAGYEEICDGCTCTPYVPVDIRFNGSWSRDADARSLVRYDWTWSDGVASEGENVERRFHEPGWYTVTLTVTDAEGLTDSLSREFYIFPYRCVEP
jgi:hypothetical protein